MMSPLRKVSSLADWPTKLYSALATRRGSGERGRGFTLGLRSSMKSSYLFREMGDFWEGMKLSVCRLLVKSCSS